MLTGKQKRYLRAFGTQLNPVAYIGKDGLTNGVIDEVRRGIEAAELVKVKIGKNSTEETKIVSKELAEMLGVYLVQVVGRNCLLFKQKKKESKFQLP